MRAGDHQLSGVRIGVFGGSFDPIHLGHLSTARAAADLLALDQVRFVPAARQPLKKAHRASVADRVAMLETALAGERRFVLDRREVERGGPSYTVDTLRSLRAAFPSDQLFLLIGSDAAAELPHWRESAAIRALAEIVVHERAGASVAAPAGMRLIAVPPVDVSASRIRSAVGQGDSIEGMVPAAVAEYIRAHRLYETEERC